MFATHTRDQLRRTYVDAWHKQLEGSVLTALETMIADVIGLHPEYQPDLRDHETAHLVGPDVTAAAENPFLHMGLHMAVREQIAIDRPPGVREVYRELQRQFRGEHAAEHVLMDALAETLWQAQRDGQTPDEAGYLALARRRLGERLRG